MAHQIRLFIPSMKCNGCISAVKKILTEEAGGFQFDINPTMKQVEVNYDLSIPLLIASLSSKGFEATEIHADNEVC